LKEASLSKPWFQHKHITQFTRRRQNPMIPTHYGRHIVNRRHFFSGFGVSYSSIYIYIEREGRGGGPQKKLAGSWEKWLERVYRKVQGAREGVCLWLVLTKQREKQRGVCFLGQLAALWPVGFSKCWTDLLSLTTLFVTLPSPIARSLKD
jgi:hypothetical protein